MRIFIFLRWSYAPRQVLSTACDRRRPCHHGLDAQSDAQSRHRVSTAAQGHSPLRRKRDPGARLCGVHELVHAYVFKSEAGIGETLPTILPTTVEDIFFSQVATPIELAQWAIIEFSKYISGTFQEQMISFAFTVFDIFFSFRSFFRHTFCFLLGRIL